MKEELASLATYYAGKKVLLRTEADEYVSSRKYEGVITGISIHRRNVSFYVNTGARHLTTFSAYVSLNGEIEWFSIDHSSGVSDMIDIPIIDGLKMDTKVLGKLVKNECSSSV